MGYIHTPPHLPPSCMAACLLVCRAMVLCGLIEVNCRIISLIKFFHSFRLSCSSSCQTRVVERRPSSIPSSGASHPPHHCWSLSQLLIPPLTPLSPAFSSYLILNCAVHSSPVSLFLFLFSRSSQSEVGKICSLTSPHLSRSHLCLSSGFHRCSMIISALIWWYFPAVEAFGAFLVFGDQDSAGTIFEPRPKRLWSFCSLCSCEMEIHKNGATCNMSNGFKRICHDTVHGFKQNCLCDICDLLIRRFKKIACICKITFVEALLVQFGSPALSLCLFVSPSSLYPLLFHFSIMETLESFTSPLSIMSFKLFPYFLFLTFSLSSSLFPQILPPPSVHRARGHLCRHTASLVPIISPTACHRQSACLPQLPARASLPPLFSPHLPHLPRLPSPSFPPSCVSSYYAQKFVGPLSLRPVKRVFSQSLIQSYG